MRHTAPRLANAAAQLYPFVRTGALDVSGGHHDAGDYSKYTINSALLIHALVFAADAFPGVGALKIQHGGEVSLGLSEVRIDPGMKQTRECGLLGSLE